VAVLGKQLEVEQHLGQTLLLFALLLLGQM
jgi:hypothetical protein